MYWVRTHKAGVSVAIHMSQSKQLGRACCRAGMSQTSRAAVREYNRRLSRRKLTLLLNTNFLPGDGHIVLNYPADARPTPEEAMHNWDVFTKAVRRACTKAGVPFKFVQALGMGEHGAIHHHLVVNKEAISIISRLWKFTKRVTVTFLYNWKNYQPLAWYFCGQCKGENQDDKKEWTIYKGYSASRNLQKPEAETKVVNADRWQKYPEAPEGYLIDVDSLDAGESPVTGRGYLYYMMLPLPPAPWKMSAAKREEWAEQERAKNAAMVRWKIDKLYCALEERKKHQSKED